MIEQTKPLKRIQHYKELKESKGGEFIFINGVGQLVIDKNSEHLKRFDNNPDKIYTLSIEGNFFVQNHYDNYAEDDDCHLEPFMKTSCRKNSDTALENVLSNLAKRGGLI